jgi:hypothetical protein
VTFCAKVASSKLIVTAGSSDQDVIVRPRVKTDLAGARSSSGVTFWTGSGGIKARGVASSTEYGFNNLGTSTGSEIMIGTNVNTSLNTQVKGNVNMVVLAKITSITNAGEADTVVPTGDDAAIGKFRFTAATNTNSSNGTNNATLSGVIFNVSATSTTLGAGSQLVTATSDFWFYNSANETVKSQCIASNAVASGSFTVRCPGLKTSTFVDGSDSVVDTSLSSGESATFVLEADIASTTTTSNLQVSLQDFTDAGDTDFGVTTASQNHIHWMDEDTTSYSFFWVEYPTTVVRSTSYKNN